MADTAISLTAIVVSGVVGPSLSAWWMSRRQRDRESAEAREAFAQRPLLMQEVRYAGDRIAIRLGVDHAVHRAYVECADTLADRHDFAHAYERGSAIEEEFERQRRAYDRYNATRAAFVEVARLLVGPRLG